MLFESLKISIALYVVFFFGPLIFDVYLCNQHAVCEFKNTAEYFQNFYVYGSYCLFLGVLTSVIRYFSGRLDVQE